ncbi:hypothetical protein AQJ66_06210 [Streptomyces bungoensis]|uniref:Uncharacterized protein n=1 Tax=Streptomyces bungoensis TaxID=285568 RepID=A0A101TB83_9ACTN|nr:hypothetical protein [Streptomyces bungoensis]KUN89048.1 hypothetical protein AQJ66_06210 [Streptomyces bungoensis]
MAFGVCWKRAGGAVVLTAVMVLLCAGHAGAAPDEATVTVTLAWDAKRHAVTATEEFDTYLAPHSSELARIREPNGAAGAEPGDMTPMPEPRVVIGGLSFPFGARRGPTSRRVTQPSADAPAHVVEKATYVGDRLPGQSTAVVKVDIWVGDALIGKGGPSHGVVVLRTPGWQTSALSGQVASQSSGEITWHVRGTEAAGAIVKRQLVTTGLPLYRRQHQSELFVALSLAVAGMAVSSAGVVGRLVPSGARGRSQAVVGAIAVITVVLAVVPYARQRTSVLGPGSQPQSIGWGYPPPESLWNPGPLLGLWLWCLLPLACWFLMRRTVTGRPPSWPALIGGALVPPFALLVLLSAPSPEEPDEWTVIRWLLFAAAAAFVGVVLLNRIFRPPNTVRHWIFTLWVLGLIAAQLWLLIHESVLNSGDLYTVRRGGLVLLLAWPPAAVCAALLPVAVGRPVRPVWRAVTFTLVWAAMWSPYWGAHTQIFFEYDTLASRQRYGTIATIPATPYSGYFGFPFLVVTVVTLAFVVVHLVRSGAAGRAAGPRGGVVLVGAAACAYGNPSLRSLTSWGSALAVLWAAVIWYVVTPPGSEAQAVALGRVSRAGHARLVAGWIRTRLVWESRGDFQRSARSELAAGQMTQAQFGARWQALEIPGAGADPGDRLARARTAALGSAAGVTAGRAGAIGACVAQILALPWALYESIGHRTLGADQMMPFGLDDAALALRFAHWALYGFVFGCFYPRLRGATPVAKAVVLLLAVMPIEVLPAVMLAVDPQYSAAPSWRALVLACAGTAGQSFVVCVGMGLVWEARLARIAGVSWRQLRDFRRVAAVTLPAGTVVVAAATAFATALAGTWAEQVVVPRPPVTSSATPSGQSSPSP